MKFKNMKVEINDQQPLDEVVSELERLGYRIIGILYQFRANTHVCTNENGYFTTLKRPLAYCVKTTLQQLKEM